ALLTAPSKDAVRFGTLKQKAVVPREATVDGFVRVKLSADRFAFVADADAKATRAKARPADQIAFKADRAPPRIALSTDAIQGPVVSDRERFTLTGTVTSEHGLMDTYVLVNDQKV